MEPRVLLLTFFTRDKSKCPHGTSGKLTVENSIKICITNYQIATTHNITKKLPKRELFSYVVVILFACYHFIIHIADFITVTISHNLTPGKYNRLVTKLADSFSAV